MVGFARIPVGVIGPLRINGAYAHDDFYVPLATNEGALVASYQRAHTLSVSVDSLQSIVAKTSRHCRFIDVRPLAPIMKRQGRVRIVNVSSIAGLSPTGQNAEPNWTEAAYGEKINFESLTNLVYYGCNMMGSIIISKN